MANIPAPRALAQALEPFAGQVYFSPECHRNYEALGFGASPGKAGETHLPNGPAYFTSRGSVMGQVPGELVAAAFGVFNPEAIIPGVDFGWTLTDAATICQARDDGAVGQLQRILGPSPDGIDTAVELLKRANEGLQLAGNPLFSGLVSLGLPGDPLADAWRLADCLREYRGDVHINVWTAAGLDAIEIGLITELFWGLPSRSYIRSRAWSDEQMDAAEERLEARGYLRDRALTDEGRAAREAIEANTDAVCKQITDNLGDRAEELIGLLAGWSKQVRAASGYLAGAKDVEAVGKNRKI